MFFTYLKLIKILTNALSIGKSFFFLHRENDQNSCLESSKISKTSNLGLQYGRGRLGRGVQPPPPSAPPFQLECDAPIYGWTSGHSYSVPSPQFKWLRENTSLPLMSSHHLIDRSFLITTYHVVSAMITCQFRHFFHLCPLIWSAADRDTVLSLEFVNEKFRCVHLSRHPSFIFASERVLLLFCSFKKKSSPKNYFFAQRATSLRDNFW